MGLIICQYKITWIKINLSWKAWSCIMHVSVLSLSRESTNCLLRSGWKKEIKRRYMYLMIEMLVSCTQMETQPVIWKMCSYWWIFTSETRDIGPSDRYTNKSYWWCLWKIYHQLVLYSNYWDKHKPSKSFTLPQSSLLNYSKEAGRFRRDH